MQTYPSDFAEKLRDARAGDQEALITLLRLATPSIRRSISISSQWSSMLDVDDVLQVTFQEAFLGLSRFVSDEPAAFEAWLKMIAKNNVRAAIRSLNSAKRPPPSRRINPADEKSQYSALAAMAALTRTPSRTVAESEAQTAIDDALEQLPKPYAAAIRLYYFDGVIGEELAARLGKSRGAAFMILARAREHLGELIGSQSRFFTDSA